MHGQVPEHMFNGGLWQEVESLLRIEATKLEDLEQY